MIMAWHSPAHFAPGDAELDLVSVSPRGRQGEPALQVAGLRQADRARGQRRSTLAGSRRLLHGRGDRAPGVTARPARGRDRRRGRQARRRGGHAEELARAKNQFETAFVERLQSLARRASLLNGYQRTKGDPGFAEQDLAALPRRHRRLAARDGEARPCCSNARVILRVVPKDQPAEAGAAKGGKK